MAGNQKEKLDNILIRKDFPALDLKIHDNPLVYLDNAASAQKPDCVLEAMRKAYNSSYANVHRGLHSLANKATELYEDARETVASFLGARSKDSVVFTKNATEAINLVAYSWGFNNLKAGDEIILSVMEHHSNLVPWHFLREKIGVKLIFLPVEDDGSFDILNFKNALSDKTKLIALTHMSNVLGTILPIKNIITIAHRQGIPVLIDGAQGAVHQPVNVKDLDCDFYVITGHKLYGPSGIGALYAKSDILDSMPPFLGGGEMVDTVSQNEITYNIPPYRFEAGTPPIVEAIGLAQALKYIVNIGLEKIHDYERELFDYAHRELNKLEGLKILGEAAFKGSIISFSFHDIHAYDLALFLDRKGVAVRAGTHCAEPLLTRFGLNSICRASLAMYNNKTEIDILVNSLHKAKIFFS